MPEWSAYFTQQKIGLRQNTEGCSCVLVMIIARQEAESGAWPPLPTFPWLASLNLPKTSSQLKGKLQQWVSQELRYTLQLIPMKYRGKAAEASSQYYWKENSNRHTTGFSQPTLPAPIRLIWEERSQHCIWILERYWDFKDSLEAQISFALHILSQW